MLQTTERTITHVETVGEELHVFHMQKSMEVLTSYPAQSPPDRVWKEVYGIKDGKMSYLHSVNAIRKSRKVETTESYLDWDEGKPFNKGGAITFTSLNA